MTRPFQRTFARKFGAPKRFPLAGATINGKPAWQAVEERKAALLKEAGDA